MNRLKIKLDPQIAETGVPASVVDKLVSLGKAGTDMELVGTINVVGGLKKSKKDYMDLHYGSLNLDLSEYLTINSPKIYLDFEDPAVETIMMSVASSDGIGVTVEDAAALLNNLFPSFENNTNITSFDELKEFTNVTQLTSNFRGCTNLTSVDLSNIQVIGHQAFFNCTGLTSINIPSGVTSIGNSAFNSCTSLTSVTISDSVTSIGVSTFQNCSGLTNCTIGSGVTSIDGFVFYNCRSLTSIEIPDSVTSIGQQAFESCRSLTSIAIPDNVTSIGYRAFAQCSGLTSCTIGSGVTSIGNNAFEGCGGLTSCTIGSGVTSIGNNAFSGCTSLESIDIPNSVTSIGTSAFTYCRSLTNIVIPDSVTSIGGGAFSGCTQLTSIDLSNTQIASVSTELFKNCSNLQTIKLPATVTSVHEKWYPGQESLKIIGLDNVSTHSLYNWLITNKSILNPIKDSLGTSGAIVHNTGNNTVTSIHSLYEPIRVSTPVGIRDTSFNVSGWLVYASGGNAMMNIGLLYLRDITSFGYVTFYRCNITNLVINNTTPPTHSTNSSLSSDEYYPSWGNSIFGDLTSSGVSMKAFIGTLWVPDSVVATYLADPQYSGLTIKGINTKTNGVDYDLPRYADFSAWEATEEAAVAQGGHAPQGLIESWM